MFEQESYKQDVTELRTQPGDLLHNYEIKNWNFTPRLYKILAGSAVFNVLALVVIGSSGMLTTRGCESPFVGRVCQVLDTVYVGTLMLGTERDYVDAPYEKTDLSDAEVTFIDVSGVEPPLAYPAGYFALANPEQQFTDVTDPILMSSPGFVAPGIPSMPNPTISGEGLINTPARTPNANPNAIQGTLPTDGPLGASTDNPTIPGNRKGRRGGRPIGTDKPSNTDVAKNELEPSPSVDPTKPLTEKDINRRPFADLAGEVNAMLANKEINLHSEFSVAARGKLNKEGKLDKTTFRFTKAASSDPKMVDVVKKSIEAFNDSGMLQYLEQLSGKDLNLSVAQDKDNISGEVRSEVERETRAQTLATGMEFFRGLAVERKKKKIADLQAENKPENAEALQNAIDELELLEKTTITSEGKQLVVKFASPKAVMHNLVQRKLEAQAKEVKKKESGGTQAGVNDNTARK